MRLSATSGAEPNSLVLVVGRLFGKTPAVCVVRERVPSAAGRAVSEAGERLGTKGDDASRSTSLERLRALAKRAGEMREARQRVARASALFSRNLAVVVAALAVAISLVLPRNGKALFLGVVSPAALRAMLGAGLLIYTLVVLCLLVVRHAHWGLTAPRPKGTRAARKAM
jgi:hypothetical protein